MIPIYKEISDIVGKNYNKGNFGLWFNKFVDIDVTKFKPDDKSVNKYKTKYDNIKDETESFLGKKHLQQYWFCKAYEKKYDILTVHAHLSSPMITGIGQTHPGEIGMTFDHTIGVPYIPASSVKGIVRFAHILNMIEDPENENRILNKEEIDDEEDWTFVKHLFGKGGDKGNVGDVIFLDAYPVKSPELAIDIINPHYQKYYDEKGKTPPGDYLEPVPIKFLTVKTGNQFIFRILIKRDIKLENGVTLTELVKKALDRVLTIEGVGAKTAVGYGRFNIISYNEYEKIKSLAQKEIEKTKRAIEEKQIEKKMNSMSEIEKVIFNLKSSKDENFSMEIYQNIDAYSGEDKKKIANALKEKWIELKKWDKKDISKKQKEKVEKIKQILGEN
ncbi:type III-B CRISPR module RAMP protein Cmr6 [Deferribacterales bacterium Es71-Z0220]|uniref:type III-B CRISPR module RAMP protein Cmr6 n=1 Tax=Deferrivibrio essentukiensis TaxID=2880922 RepID=UPI001F601177|nr:type III-B CRISPR module RAMP protein Cmr6 [Deferrivibrio essentukiensis]MCB4205243.1 type III-B CRISPR module RAMP protein Cmr6 [Deferrivibrio essentukiensis]